MSLRPRPLLFAAAFAGATLALYSPRLVSGPPPLPAEAPAAAAAKALAADGRDPTGHRLPLFIQSTDQSWLQPVQVYAAAGLVALSGGADGAPRLASAAAAALNVALIFLVARRLWPDTWAGPLAALLLALTPAHFIYGRLGADAIFVVPFILGWLLGLLHFLSRPAPPLLAAAMLCLGVGALASSAAPVSMLALAALSLVVLRLDGRWSTPVLAAAIGAFGLPVIAMAAWFAWHPTAYADTMGRWAIMAAHIRNPLDLWRASVNWNTLATRTALYWDFFNPAALTFARDASGPWAVARQPAPWLMPFLVFVPLGIAAVVNGASRAAATLLVAGLLLSPVSASTYGERYATGMALAVLPFAVLLASAGAAALLRPDRPTGSRVVAAILLLAVPLQFALFAAAYVGR